MGNLPQRKQVRLKGYDYSQAGCYFITICTKNRECLFGNVVEGKILLSEYGKIVWDKLSKISLNNKNVFLDKFVVMPNHIHLIIHIADERTTARVVPTDGGERIVGTGLAPVRNDDDNGDNAYTEGRTTARVVPTTPTIPGIVGALKSESANEILRIHKNYSNDYMGKIWQRSYHDHIIRNGDSYLKILNYIENNPMQWELDCHNPNNPKYKDWSEK